MVGFPMLSRILDNMAAKKAQKYYEAGAAKRPWLSNTEVQCGRKKFDMQLQYVQVCINFGYCHFFVICFPGVAIIAWLVSWVQQHGDRYMLTHVNQRPMPIAKESVGAWLKYMRYYSR